MELQQIQSYLSRISHSLTEQPASKDEPFWGKDGFDFADILDIVNPLQHLPVISRLYRDQTNDDVSEGSRLFGGLVFGSVLGGVSGAIAALTNSAVRHETRQDIGDYLIAEVSREVPERTRTQVAQTEENPFFAQLFDTEQGDQSYQVYASAAELAEQRKEQRITEWGKV